MFAHTEFSFDHYSVAFDPGRVRVVHGIKFDREGKVVEIIDLTRYQLYTEAKITSLNKTRKTWALDRMRDSALAKSLHHLKTADVSKFEAGLIAIVTYYAMDWAEWNNNCWRRKNLYGHGRKRSVLRLTLNRFAAPPGERVVVAYGSGDVAATAKNELSVPTQEVKRQCEALYEVVEVDEWGTSTGCYHCGSQLFPEYIVHNETVYSLRGTKDCGCQACRTKCIKHREDAGSFGIFESFKHQVYGHALPPILDQNHPIQANRKSTKKLAYQRRQTAPHTNIPKKLRKKMKKRQKAEKRWRRHERERTARAAEED